VEAGCRDVAGAVTIIADGSAPLADLPDAAAVDRRRVPGSPALRESSVLAACPV